MKLENSRQNLSRSRSHSRESGFKNVNGLVRGGVQEDSDDDLASLLNSKSSFKPNPSKLMV